MMLFKYFLWDTLRSLWIGFMWDVFGDRTLYGITKPFPNVDVRSCYQIRNMMLKILNVDFDCLPVCIIAQWYFLDDWLCRGGLMLQYRPLHTRV